MRHIWVLGPRYNLALLLDRSSGHGERYTTDGRVGPCAGVGARLLSGRYAAVFNDEHDEIRLNVAGTEYIASELTVHPTQSTWDGLVNHIVVETSEGKRIDLRHPTPFRPIGRLIDFTWDGLDELAEDQLGALHNAAEHRRDPRRGIMMQDHGICLPTTTHANRDLAVATGGPRHCRGRR
jgi:hypothetical protein